MNIKKLQIRLFLFSKLLYLNIYASTLFVPSQYITIQSAIDASINGDSILVSPGTYNEGINFHGKSIIVKSTKGPDVTRIDAPALYAVTFNSGEDTYSILWGFSIGPEHENTHSNFNGILCSASSPTIVGNIVERVKRAIMIIKGSPTIKRNIIRESIWFENTSGIFIADTCAPVIVNNIIYGYHQGIRISGSTATIIFNTIDHNKYGVFGVDSCIIKNNIITNGNYGIFSVSSPREELSHNDVWNNSIRAFDLNYQNCDPGQNDISVDPMFSINSLFSLQENSPCIDNGKDVGIYEDFYANKRPSGGGFDIGAIEIGAPSDILEKIEKIPSSFFIKQNYPNPFNCETTITYFLEKNEEINIQIFNSRGQIIRRLCQERQPKGIHTIRWNCEDDFGNFMSSAMYVCRIQIDYKVCNIKMLLIK